MASEVALRVLVLGNLPPHVLGGAENQIARLVEQWRQAGVHVEVAGHRIPEGEQQLGAQRVRTHRLRAWASGGRAGRALGYFLSLARLARQRPDFDIAYCRGLGDGAVALAILATLGLCRWRLVACPINARGTGDIAFLRSIPGWRLWCLLLDRQLVALNLINPLIADDLDTVGIRQPPRSHIPNGIPLKQPLPRQCVGSVRRLVWTGRMEPQKGLDLLLPALAECRAAGHCFELRLFGNGPLQAALEAQVATLGLADCVSFPGPLPASAVRDALREADVFVLPSRYEGMSNAALEAMEAGLPVLCTRCGGIDAAVAEGAGWVCAPDDPAALTQALLAMFESHDQTLLDCGQQARALVEARYDIEVIARANLDWLKQVKAESHR